MPPLKLLNDIDQLQSFYQHGNMEYKDLTLVYKDLEENLNNWNIEHTTTIVIVLSIFQ